MDVSQKGKGLPKAKKDMRLFEDQLPSQINVYYNYKMVYDKKSLQVYYCSVRLVFPTANKK